MANAVLTDVRMTDRSHAGLVMPCGVNSSGLVMRHSNADRVLRTSEITGLGCSVDRSASRSSSLRRPIDSNKFHHGVAEAQYQNELYRGLIAKFHGSVRITPEFASGTAARLAGRIDFYIPQTKWGIECMRDGIRLQEHASRFDAIGASGQWTSEEMDDYILLDFRSTRPEVANPGMTPLRLI